IKVEAQALWFTRERRFASTGPFQQNGRVPIEKPRWGKTFSVEGSRSSRGRAGCGRACCQNALLYRSVKPKRALRTGDQSCGRGQIQAPAFTHGVSDYSLSLLLL
ncbi:MAG TPA: hypothetical protein VHZ51_06660, partial [Ktedonobacteraceae bacterium]|nr:hypothetical protein [Ktedonobacteraceae bacterium]